jgi:hypothetical protein
MGRLWARIVVVLALAAVLVPLVHEAQARGRHRGGYYGRSYWRFSHRDRARWHHGYWWHGWRHNRYAWWWVVDGYWYPYPVPYYPYPVYIPPAVAVQPAPPPVYSGAPPTQNWYFCNNPRGYYPYVRSCRGPWRPVPVTPPGSPPRSR